ncbi:hypothetical protein EMIHUDRAFT_218286 [Emiliania huxleyi CCMP1516]|uniref:Major facilitator superfamily (MFS) profile domain-containing protein n=2 Tax=Emiliania huxleyi TaxID=2903 RepID=A0A0D3I901_EMIH1|nr:hypothetical protein EMIHUDRAFT_218286 [Emiliania huxleyi CCMP1516]EOD07736.1 hypothetical protein EMIHUDRAFT_218286 [Emiliania huxleyi CCMP1516]|eukprot:XP_005760165.1 hypothetical protein EMIHUDRAFT_218286 [Emiliania huxleyi CCMP1516]
MADISARSWLLLSVTYLAYVCIYCARKPFAVAKTSIKDDLGVADGQLGLIDTVLLATYAVGQLSLAHAVRRFGRRWTLVLAFALSGAATAAFGLCSSAPAMMAAWGAAGLFAAPASPLFSTLVGEAVPDAVRGTVLGVWSSCENLGGAVANSIAASALGGGWRRVFFVSGPVVSVWAVALMFRPLGVPGVGGAAAAYALTKTSRYIMMFWLTVYLKEHILMSASNAGHVSSVLDVAGTVGAVLTGVATDRLFGGCALRVAMHSCCATGACFLALMLACLCDMPWATHVAAIASIGFFIAGPGGVLGRSDDKQLVAAVAGLVNGLASTGPVFGVLVAPQLKALAGWPGLFGALGAAMLAAAAVLRPAVAIEGASLAKLKRA